MKLLAPSLAIVGALAAWAGVQLFGSGPDAEAVARGRAHVEKTCVGCHPGSQLDVVAARRLDPADRDPMDRFLAGHHVADPALRADVIAYLETRLPAADPES